MGIMPHDNQDGSLMHRCRIFSDYHTRGQLARLFSRGARPFLPLHGDAD
jgi:hypothetical protein